MAAPKKEYITGYGKLYTVGESKVNVEICGVKTQIAHFLKGGQSLDLCYCIKKIDGRWECLDIRDFPDWKNSPLADFERSNLQNMSKHISDNQEFYKQYL